MSKCPFCHVKVKENCRFCWKCRKEIEHLLTRNGESTNDRSNTTSQNNH